MQREDNKNRILPSYIELGIFKSIRKPLLIPLQKMDMLVLDADSIGLSFCNRIIEQNILELYSQLQKGLIKVNIFDFGIGSQFPFITHLSTISKDVQFINSTNNCTNKLEELNKEARRILRDVLSTDYASLDEYNANTDFLEAYNIIVFVNFPNSFDNKDLDYIYNITKQTGKLGFKIFLIYQKDKSNNSKYSQEKQNHILANGWIFRRITGSLFKIDNLFIKPINILLQKSSVLLKVLKDKTLKEQISKIILEQKNNQSDGEQDYISVPIGTQRNGKDDFYFTIGPKSSAYHTIIGGRSGTGKSTFLRNLIIQLGLHYSPDLLQIYLLDYKSGLEAECFREHPNIKCLLLDRTNSRFDIALEVLEDFEGKIKERNNLFIELGNEIGKPILNLQKYNEYNSTKLPFLLLVVDEANKIFERTVDVDLYQKISAKFINIAQQGRGAGVYFILCATEFEQQVRNIDAILNQIHTRIGFMMNDARAVLGFHSNNSVKKLKKYQFIYNNENGLEENNEVVSSLNMPEENVANKIMEMKRKFPKSTPLRKNIIEIKTLESSTEQKEIDPMFSNLM